MKSFKKILGVSCMASMLALSAIVSIPTTNVYADLVQLEESSPSSLRIEIINPGDFTLVDGSYVVKMNIYHKNEIEGIKFLKGQYSWNDRETVYGNGAPCLDELSIPYEESDVWYTVVAKDEKGNFALQTIYIHCDAITPTPVVTNTPTPTEEVTVTVAPITITPQPEESVGCPDGIEVGPDGSCLFPKSDCDDGYVKNNDGICIEQCPEGSIMNKDGQCVTPTPVVTSTPTPEEVVVTPAPTVVVTPQEETGCPEGLYMDENGNCQQKVTSLPQTGGLDGLQMVLFFGIGIAACGTGVIAYATKKNNTNTFEDDEDDKSDDNE